MNSRWPGVTKPGTIRKEIVSNLDFAETFLDAAGVKVPADMQGRSFIPLRKGETPADWRTSMYYRYYHDPGDHNTRAHYGVRTETQKLIYFWKKNQWELYDLTTDPIEAVNRWDDPDLHELRQHLRTQLKQVRTEAVPERHNPWPYATRRPPTRKRRRLFG